MDGFDDKMNKRMNRLLRFTLFSSFFFRVFGPLVFFGVLCIILGFFKQPFFYVGGAFFALDLILTILMMYRFHKMQSNNPEYERFRQAMSGANPYEGLNKLTDEWAGQEFFRARLELYSEEASMCKTVEDAYKLYKEHSTSFLNDRLYFEFTVGNKVCRDDKEHFVISFDRQREVNDDVIVHMWFDLIFDPGTVSAPDESILCESYQELDDYLEKVESYLTKNNLMGIKVKEIDVDTDE